jgi:hypothetical protein
MAYGTRVKVDPLRELDFGDISGTYAAVGTPMTDHVRILSLNNGCDEDLYVSLDGVNDHFRLPKNSFALLDLSSNKIREDGLFLSIGTQIYVKEVSASVSTGAFWLTVVYGEGGK